MIVLVRIQTSHCIFSLKSFLLKHFKDLFLIWYLVVTNDQPLIHTDRLMNLKPGMIPYFRDFVSLLGVSV